jgi:uncharacterized membrane protein
MRRKLFIGGIVLLILGLLLVLIGVVVQNTATSVAIPAGSADQLSPSSIGGSSFSATWSGATATTTVYLVSGTPSCTSPQGVVAQGTGASGSLSASLSSGSTYQLYACSAGLAVGLNVSWTATGLSILMVIGIVLALVGVVVAALGMMGKPKDAPADMGSETPADEPPADPPAA